jgi:hypothetical protein
MLKHASSLPKYENNSAVVLIGRRFLWQKIIKWKGVVMEESSLCCFGQVKIINKAVCLPKIALP